MLYCKAGYILAFFIGEKMIFWLQMALAFIAGMVVSKIWSSFVTVGYSILMLKEVQLACLKLYKEVMSNVAMAQEVKYNFLVESGEDEKRVRVLKMVDSQTISTIKKSMVRTLINSTPKNLSTTIQYESWDEAMQILKESK
jgi:hypothetical protein